MAGQARAKGADDPAAEGPSPMAFVLALLALTVVGATGGGLLGLKLVAAVERAGASSATQADQPREKLSAYEAVHMRTLPPIVTNLAGPDKTWIRLEASIVLAPDPGGDPNEIAARVAEDTLAYLRTMTLAQIQGATGFQSLREDLKDRVRIRTGGKARDLVIQALVVE
jgi:flagellar FliL protein